MRIRHPWITKVLSGLLVALFQTLFRTVRAKLRFDRPGTSPYQPVVAETFIYSVWHDSMVVPIFLGCQESTVALVGRHRDGSYVANVLASVGIPSVRGSSSKGGARAARQLIKQTRDYHIVVTPDGPRGPRRRIKPGLAWIASRTGKPVVATAFACSRSWSIRGSWTHLMIPVPFSKVYALTGNPIRVPPLLEREQLEQYTAAIQADMDRLNELATKLASGVVAPDRKRTHQSRAKAA